MARLLVCALLAILASGCTGIMSPDDAMDDAGIQTHDVRSDIGLNPSATPVVASNQTVSFVADSEVKGIHVAEGIENTTIRVSVPRTSYLDQYQGLWLRVVDPDGVVVATSPTMEIFWTPTMSGAYDIQIMAPPGSGGGSVASDRVSVYFE